MSSATLCRLEESLSEALRLVRLLQLEGCAREGYESPGRYIDSTTIHEPLRTDLRGRVPCKQLPDDRPELGAGNAVDTTPPMVSLLG